MKFTCRHKYCKVMPSKKRPLFLVWNNPDSMADECPYNDYRIIFKNGDGRKPYHTIMKLDCEILS